jgi:hypothetical protein
MGTIFEEWCRENGYDPESVFIITEDCDLDRKAGFSVNSIVELVHDDGSDAPKFCLFEDSSIERFLDLRHLKQIKQHNTEEVVRQNKSEPIQFDPHTFDFRQVLPKCWVRDMESDDWVQAWFLIIDSACTFTYAILGADAQRSNFKFCTFEDPTIEQRKTELKARAD